MNQTAKKSVWVNVLFWAALLTSWITLLFIFAAPIGLIFWLIALITMFVRKTKLKWYLLAFSAWTFLPAFSFLKAAAQYATGHASMEHIGLPSHEFFNLDSELRTWNHTSGCYASGTEPLTQYPNNFAIRLCTSIFGYQPGVYHGQYPDKEQALTMIQTHGKVIRFTNSNKGFTFPIGTQTITLNNVYPTRARHWITGLPDSCRTATVTLVNNELIIFAPTACQASRLYLAEYPSGNIFASYRLPLNKGNTASHL